MNKSMKIYENHIMNMKVIFRVINTTYLYLSRKLRKKSAWLAQIYIFFAFLGFLCFEHKPRILNNHADGLSQLLLF